MRFFIFVFFFVFRRSLCKTFISTDESCCKNDTRGMTKSNMELIDLAATSKTKLKTEIFS